MLDFNKLQKELRDYTAWCDVTLSEKGIYIRREWIKPVDLGILEWKARFYHRHHHHDLPELPEGLSIRDRRLLKLSKIINMRQLEMMIDE